MKLEHSSNYDVQERMVKLFKDFKNMFRKDSSYSVLCWQITIAEDVLTQGNEMWFMYF